MSVVVNEGALANFLRSTFGPVGRDLAARTAQVQVEAAVNASGRFINVRTEDLRNSIRGRVEGDALGLRGVVSSDATHRGFLYPAFVHRAEDEPGAWLREALRDGFRRGI